MELEENIRRKDLTEYEKNKAMVEYVEAVKEALEEGADLLPESGNKSRGRPEKVASQAKVAERTGIPRSTAVEARSHWGSDDKPPTT